MKYMFANSLFDDIIKLRAAHNAKHASKCLTQKLTKLLEFSKTFLVLCQTKQDKWA